MLIRKIQEVKCKVFLTDAEGASAMSDPHVDQFGHYVPKILLLILGALKTSHTVIFCFGHSSFAFLKLNSLNPLFTALHLSTIFLREKRVSD